MKQPKPATIDFETQGIEGRPKYPPIPVGVSIKYPGKKAKYWAWGHPTGNNCCWSDAAAELKKAWAYKEGLLFQRELAKLEKDIGGIQDMNALPDAIFVIDVGYHKIAVAEAVKLGIPVIGVDRKADQLAVVLLTELGIDEDLVLNRLFLGEDIGRQETTLEFYLDLRINGIERDDA